MSRLLLGERAHIDLAILIHVHEYRHCHRHCYLPLLWPVPQILALRCVVVNDNPTGVPDELIVCGYEWPE